MLDRNEWSLKIVLELINLNLIRIFATQIEMIREKIANIRWLNVNRKCGTDEELTDFNLRSLGKFSITHYNLEVSLVINHT